jgi:hypothetical protein
VTAGWPAPLIGLDHLPLVFPSVFPSAFPSVFPSVDHQAARDPG